MILKKRAIFTVPISILLIAVIVASFLLMNIKPETSKISQAQKLSEYSKPAVVRIVEYAVIDWNFYDLFSDVGYEVDALLAGMNYQTYVGGSGSGAVISSDGYIVTNAHVVEGTQLEDAELATRGLEQLASIVADYFQVDYQTAYEYMWTYAEFSGVTRVLKVVLPGGEVLDGEVKSYGAPVTQGKDVAVLKIEGKDLPTLKLGNSETVGNQNNIWVIGYPAAAESDLFSTDSLLESSMNAGQVSSASKTLEQGGSPVIQIDAAATHGNSGGPVINEKGDIIGLLTFRGDTVNGVEVQGFNFAVPVNTVKEFVNQAGAKNKSSRTDKLYKEGLELYWGGYYKNALEKFEAVARIYPNHSEVKDYIANSQNKIDESKILWSDYKTLFYIIDGIAVLLIIFLMLFTYVFIRKPAQAASPSSPSASDTIPDLNGDGKIDMKDVQLLQKEKELDNEKKNE
ncbi:trypsin-like peptidase domain-containing protein [Bacillus benzoevorans]|uniref:S1-C subfamily serine protease n=1 Tax=Bacillus benzoevorans TaxID=1456 RepID=A0A7X0HPS9_9BACI|nr:trypsin-like peptidase domain-containing protein [Bacillus benzoevorans]MBB6444618.1 S1-C subfamily serine protease [Bacillus benzoevorans]